MDRLLVLDPILPQILKLRTSRHGRTAFFGALFTNSPIDEVDSVEEVHHVDSKPVIEIFTFWQLDHLSEVDPRIKTGLCLLVQGVLHCPRLELLLRSKCFLLIEHLAEFG